MDIEKLIERLKYDAADWAGDPHIKKDLFEAADTIETLRAENQDLRSDAAPVRRGSWEIKEFPFSHCKKMSCSICGYNESRGPAWNENFGLPNYCPINHPERIIRKPRIPLPADEILAQLAEEATEMAQAALKLRRAMTGINPTPVTREAAESNLDEEISDTALCLELLGLAADQRTMEAKLARWRERLEGGR